MGVDRPGYRCRWVRDRLPLLTGGELTGTDRRHVERHLIACPGCRRHERSLSGALGALRAAASAPPLAASAAEAPSLWPALARQIRESRHEPRPPWAGAFAPLFRPALVVASGLVLAALTATGVDAWVRREPGSSGRPSAAPALASASAAAEAPTEAPAAAADDPETDPDPVPPPVVSVAAVEPSSPGRKAVSNDPPAPAARLDYDLDHGTPMGPDVSDVKASY